MTNEQMQKLKRKAEAAGGQYWQVGRFVDSHKYDHQSDEWKRQRCSEEMLTVRGPGEIGSPECNPIAKTVLPEFSAHIAAANPQAVLALIERVEELEKVVPEKLLHLPPANPHCKECHGTGFYGDHGTGVKGNHEYQVCECRLAKEATDD